MLSLPHLRYFHDAALHGSVAAAAKKHRVTPSAVSQAIRGLEQHFGSELLRHSKNRFELTDAGRMLLEHSHGVFAITTRLEQQMDEAKAGLTGTVSFATQQSLAHHVLPPFLAHMQKKFPGIKPHVRLATTSAVKRWLELREVEFILSVDNIAYEAMASKPVVTGEFAFVTAEEREGAPRPEGFLVTGGTRETQQFRTAYTDAHGKAPQVAMEIDSWGVIKRFAARGLGIGMIPDYILRYDPPQGLKRLDLGLPPLPYSVNAYYCRKRNEVSKLAAVFLAELESFKG